MDKDKHKDDDMILKPDLDITFGDKASLRRSEETGILLEDEKIIALMEGDIREADVNGELATVYANTILQPDTAVVYPDHASLKRKAVFIPMAARYAAAAAILLLISLGTWFTFSPGTSPDRVQYMLAAVEAKSVKLVIASTANIQLHGSNSGYSMIAAREEYPVYKINGKNPHQLQVQYAISISDEMSDIFPPNPQPSTLNPIVYANAEPKKRTLMGKVFSGMFNKIKSPFEPNEAQAKPGPKKGFSFWNLAELGVKGVNTLGDHEYTLVRDYNKKGNVKGLIIVDE